MTPDAASHFQKHCPGCFQLKGGVAVCPHCGYDEGAQRSPIFLPHGTILGGQYRTGRVLGRPGGFGITYLGWDVNLQQRVAIKEYLPREIAQRLPNSLNVDVHTAEDKRGFEFGKEQFLREARIVAKLDHGNIVRVRNFFNANSTAYLVMDYYEGMSLGDYLSSVRNKLEPELAVPLVKPILEGLQYVHERGLVHRDLKPHNIYLAAIGRPIVLDFGAARQAAGDRVQSLSVVLTEGYAPLEQYQRRAVQGPWTDVYGVAATLYRMITGAAPPIALDRIGRDPVEDGGWSAVPPALIPALRMALAVRPSDRYQSAIEFRAALDRFMSSGQGSGTLASELIPTPAPFAASIDEPPVDAAAMASNAERASITAPRPAIVERPASAEAQRAMPRAMPGSGLPAAVSNAIKMATPATLAGRAPPTVTGPVASMRSEAAAQAASAVFNAPPAGVALAALATPAPVPVRTRMVDTRLHHRASAVTPAADFTAPEVPRWKQMLPWLLLVVAGIAVGYVLLNPPSDEAGSRVRVAQQTPRSAEPLPVLPAVVPSPQPAASAAPVQLPSLVALPGGSVKLLEPNPEAGAPAISRSAQIASVKMGRTEVTVAEFRDFVQRTGYDNPRWQNYPCESAGGRLPDWQDPGYAQRDESPVVCVSWADADAYAQWLTRETGQTWRLPSEAEWEYAARAGTQSRYWWGESFDPGMAACQSCPPKVPTQPSVVTGFPPNPFGLYETLGNVREWTCSVFESYQSDSAEQCGVLPSGGRLAVRGGSWQQTADALSASYREAYEPYRRNVWTGFRVVQDERIAAAPDAGIVSGR
ncbi:MAG: SUMF1/EgtB/PvdO family nonheme iron enzyme [Pseudomonadota bacterium]